MAGLRRKKKEIYHEDYKVSQQKISKTRKATQWGRALSAHLVRFSMAPFKRDNTTSTTKADMRERQGREKFKFCLKKKKKAIEINKDRWAWAAEQGRYHKASMGMCCKALLLLLSLQGARLWGKRREGRDKEGLLGGFKPGPTSWALGLSVKRSGPGQTRAPLGAPFLSFSLPQCVGIPQTHQQLSEKKGRRK